ncbi:M48 family metalloprotease [Iodobacter sp. CM08]|uniref:M48 family metalloprotease n=1 Tax=Iodobacter sp. CM08 TaxID=3085902 RepID=UPI0029810E9E|nr:M48 family metalloprotease [Iodobacter sp. CM08]MDW5417768.1 M48 family metalloprotease [Iodobacter sp. CM08]
MKIKLLALLLIPSSVWAFDLGGLITSISDTVKNTAEANRTISPEEEQLVGAGLASNLLGAAPLVASPALQHYVNQVGMWVAKQSEQPNLAWHFGVIDSPNINAFATPGGYILLTRGLMNILRSEAELATVLGHEIGHVLKHHHMRAIQADKGKEAFGSALQGVVAYKDGGAKNQLGANVIKGFSETYIRGLDKGDEYEGDVIGMVLAARAGYNPYALVSVLQTMAAINPQDSTVALMFSTHPSPSDRLNKIDQVIGDKLESFAGGIENTKRFQALKSK